MKKVYKKPAIVFENFSLSTNIAGDCEAKTNTPTSAQGCGYQPEGVTYTIFLTTMGGCDRKFEDGAANPPYNGICYHVPSSLNSVFNS